MKKIILLPLFAAFALPAMAQPLSLKNSKISADWNFKNGKIIPLTVKDTKSGETQKLGSELFEIRLTNGKTIKSSEMTVSEAPKMTALSVNPKASRYSDRIPGKEVTAKFTHSDPGLSVTWHAVLRKGSRYLREKIDVKATGKDLAVKDFVLFDAPVEGAEIACPMKDGKPITQGTPVITKTEYLGVENPLSSNLITNGNVVCALPFPKDSKIAKGVLQKCSLGIGFVDKGQMRRQFLAYIERERAHPYRPFLNYNTWYDLGYFTPYTSKQVVERINEFGKKLVDERHVKMSSFLLDDGWDNHKTLWHFSAAFPDGLTQVAQAAKKYGFAPGIWLSPWGGYGKPKQLRIKYGRELGYKIVDGSFSMSDPKYFKTFSDLCTSVVKKYGVNQFKFDGIGGGPNAMSDFNSMLKLIAKLRSLEPDIYINQTTGTWPSPYWLMDADSIWRGGWDHTFADKVIDSKNAEDDGYWIGDKNKGHFGDKRQQWITYRDGDTYARIVKGGKLYPLNSLMLHGIIFAKLADGLKTATPQDFRDEVRSFFGTGTQMQEMYITPTLLSEQNWDDLAASANWSRKNAETLKDTHWIGGSPAAAQVYGWAAWSPEKGIFTLRNPSDKASEISIDAAKIFQLPKDASTSYKLSSPYLDQHVSVSSLTAGKPVTIHLKPFQVLVLEAHPQK